MEPRFSGYPFPLRIILQHLGEASDPIARFIQLGNLFEVTLRYLASLTLGLLAKSRRECRIEIPPRVLAGLLRPSLGHWCQVLRTIPTRLARTGPLAIPELLTLTLPEEQPDHLVRSYREVQEFLGNKKESVPRRLSLSAFLDLHVAFRNKTKAHGAIQGPLAAGLNPILEASLQGILGALPLLEKYPLALSDKPDGGGASSLEFREFRGRDPEPGGPDQHPGTPDSPAGELWVLTGSGTPLFPLTPAAWWESGDFWFLNGWESPEQVEFLSYSTGRIRTRPCPEIVWLGGTPSESAPAPLASTLQWQVTGRPIWDLPVDVAIMAQDRHRVFGPVQEVSTGPSDQPQIRRLLSRLEGEPAAEKLGTVLLSSRSWCAARFLLEVIIYDLDQATVTDREALRLGLQGALRQAGELGAETMALSPLGTEYGVIAIDEFCTLLAEALEQEKSHLKTLGRLVITPREESQVKPFQAALARRFGVSVRTAD